ncbi:MAG: hypothetical protein KGJ78_16840 [Alphaproteobacteria bacterium]|nr:hypothetical protein [Alphaproteobacteria bacterium]
MKVLGALTIPLALATGAAHAGAWIPDAGTGDAKAMVRYSSADQSFPEQSFSTTTLPSSTTSLIQLRLVGEQGLGNGFSLDYDLRYGFLHRSKTKHGVTFAEDRSGLQEQRIGLNYGLTQDEDFADAVGLSVVTPGTTSSSGPQLGSGQWAMEPVYRIGFKPGFWHLTGNFDVSSRVFLDGGAAQFRTHLEIAVPVFDKMHLSGNLFFVRTARMAAFSDARDRGELYNLLRLGVEARYRLTDYAEPFVGYENDVAGMGGHASQRLTFGVKISY